MSQRSSDLSAAPTVSVPSGRPVRAPRMVTFTALLLAAVLAPTATRAVAQEAPLAEAGTGRITATGEGAVAAVPDVAEISLAVVREAPGAGEALDAASAATAEVLAAMGAMGIEARDVRTADVSLEPVYDAALDPLEARRSPAIVAYRARNALVVRVRAFDRLGAVIDRAVELGANEGGGLRLMVADEEALRDRARRLAVVDARERAAGMAEAAGVTLGPLVSLGEGGGVGPLGAPRMAMMEARAVPVAAGETEVSASVTAVYAIAGQDTADGGE